MGGFELLRTQAAEMAMTAVGLMPAALIEELPDFEFEDVPPTAAQRPFFGIHMIARSP